MSAVLLAAAERAGTRDERRELTRAALDEAVRRAGRLGPSAGGLTDTRPPLPAPSALESMFPDGLRRGLSVGIGGGVAATSLALAVVGAASGAGSWCALVGLPPLTHEALTGFGLDLSRLAVVPLAAPAPDPDNPGTPHTAAPASRAAWTTAVGALVDAVDVVVVRPPGRLPDGDVRRLTARARSRGAVLVVFTPSAAGWPGLDVRLAAEHVRWDGENDQGYGRLRARQVVVRSTGRGRPSAPVPLWLPGASGGVELVSPATITAIEAPLLHEATDISALRQAV